MIRTEADVRVIGAGMGRTGTMSLQAALEQLLGGRCYHMQEIVPHPEHLPTWLAATRGASVDWGHFLEGYVAGVDWPIASFYAELAEAFPDAKFVLTVRDPQAWYRSVASTIYPLSQTVGRPPARWAIDLGGHRALFPIYGEEAIWGPAGVFGGRFEDVEHAISVFEAHNAEVQRVIPADRLLVYEVSQGWGPLCDFLDLPAPEGAFPRVNSTREMKRRIGIIRALGWALAPVTGPVAALRGRLHPS